MLGEAYSQTTELKLEHWQNWLEWEAIPASFINPGQGRVELRLEGFTEKWRPIEASQRYSISNLNPGTCRLLARSISAEGLIGPEQMLMKVQIMPAWYQTWWFLVSTILVLGGLLYAFHRFRVAQIEAKQAIENKYLDELRSLEMRMLRVQINPHFIFNALNSVRY